MERLFEAHADDVFRYAVYMLGNTADAKDVVQDVFLKAFRAWDNMGDRSHPKAWLLHTTRNHLRDVMRRQRTRRKWQQNAWAAPEFLESHEPGVDRQIDLERALGRLKPAFQEVLVLRFFEDLSIEETARTLQWTAGKVRTTQHRALQKLGELLGGGTQDD